MQPSNHPPPSIITRIDASALSRPDSYIEHAFSSSSSLSPSPLTAELSASPLSRETSVPSPCLSGSVSAPSSPSSSSLVSSSASTLACSPSSSLSASSLSSSSAALFPPRRCQLCNYASSIDPSVSHTCTRCGLTTAPLCADFSLDCALGSSSSQSSSSSIIAAAATAYRFQLLSRMSPLLSDLSRIVVDYLIWYRLPTDFHVGDLVDVQDVRGVWMAGGVKAVEGDEVLLGYAGCSRKWDQWIAVNSERLAPYRTKTQPGHSKPEPNAADAASETEHRADATREAESHASDDAESTRPQ